MRSTTSLPRTSTRTSVRYEHRTTSIFAAGLACVAALVSVVVATAAPLSPFPAATITVASGSWNGNAWTFRAGDHLSGDHLSYCLDVSFTSRLINTGGDCGAGASVGRPSPSAPPDSPFGLGMSRDSLNCPVLAFVDGFVVANARTVSITLSTGATIRTPTIAPPARLVQNVRFFVTRIACGSQPTSVYARDTAGHIVARMP